MKRPGVARSGELDGERIMVSQQGNSGGLLGRVQAQFVAGEHAIERAACHAE
jgi:hypothetical protein